MSSEIAITPSPVGPTPRRPMGIEEVLTAPRSPWQNAYVERFNGSGRRECLDHVILLSATGLQRLMHLYCGYYEYSRTHLSLNEDAPILARRTRNSLTVLTRCFAAMGSRSFARHFARRTRTASRSVCAHGPLGVSTGCCS
jgi:hypothetical protein